jgi:hypothetical protein
MTHAQDPFRAPAQHARPSTSSLNRRAGPDPAAARLGLAAGAAALVLLAAACSRGEVDAAASEPGAMLTREELAAAAQANAAEPVADPGSGEGASTAAQAVESPSTSELAPPPCETPLDDSSAKSPGPSGAPAVASRQTESSPIRSTSTLAAPIQSAEGTPARASGETASSAMAPQEDDELSVAKELALRPEGFEVWLAERPRALVGARRDLALGLAAGVRGDKQKALAMLAVVDGASAVRMAESTALRRLTEGPGALAVPASAADGEPALVLGAALGSLARRAQESARAGKSGEAAALWTEALELQLRAPWKLSIGEVDQWARSLAEVQRRRRWSPEGGWAAREIAVVAGDSLIGVRKRALELDPQLLVCTGQIARANGLKGERIHPGQKLKIPLDRANLVVDLEAHLVLYYLGDELVALWPCGVGAERSPTKAGRYTVGEKTREPMWFRPGAEPVPYGDPANPLGTRWIEWVDERGRSSGFGFHGTNEPNSIGGAASQGCIRMRDADVEELFEIAPKGAVVEVRA